MGIEKAFSQNLEYVIITLVDYHGQRDIDSCSSAAPSLGVFKRTIRAIRAWATTAAFHILDLLFLGLCQVPAHARLCNDINTLS
jgi:poly(A) polymerase Pap1